jgi:DNA ligase-associated metallophosphoesterase
MEAELQGNSFRFDASGALYWRETNSILLADLHLGKESVFQQSGLAIPAGATNATLGALRLLVHQWQPDRVIVLGDLLHAKIGLTEDLERELVSLVRDGSCMEWLLIPGNHDRGGVAALSRCGWQIVAERIEINGVELMHSPESRGPSRSLSISGHLHPSIRVSLNAREKKLLRCYWHHASHLILPAFGGWTGTKPILPLPGDRIFACAEDEVIELAT